MSTLADFRAGATIAIEDLRLQGALEGATSTFRTARERALDALPDSDALRDHFKAIRRATLADLATYLERFERNATAAGATVHWARDGAEARAIITRIARDHGVTLATKSKSMATEEIHLNAALEAAGVAAVETDLGEYLIQLADQPPSHIIAPAIHMTRAEVAVLLGRAAARDLDADDIPVLAATARALLREKFLAAGLGISGANIGVAESGSVVLVTNEGNGRMVTSTPRVHVALMGIEKIAPDWDAAACWLALLARSATGQPLSIYTSILTGPARADDPDGPEEMHIVLLDNGRAAQVGTRYEEVLQCIRCGACLNACPVYREAGGHAYGSPYSGPIGAVVSPLFFGLEPHAALPHASTLCGACRVVCPVRIDLPRMLLALREDEVDAGLVPLPERVAERAVARLLGHARGTGLAARAARLAQRPLTQDGRLALPAALDVGGEREIPALAERSFHDLWASGELEGLA